MSFIKINALNPGPKESVLNVVFVLILKKMNKDVNANIALNKHIDQPYVPCVPIYANDTIST